MVVTIQDSSPNSTSVKHPVKHLQEEDPVLDDESSSTTSSQRSGQLLDSYSYANHKTDQFVTFRHDITTLFLRLLEDREQGVTLDINKKEGPVSLWKGSVKGSPWAILKASVEIKASLDVISEFVYDPANITCMDKMVKVAHVVEDLSEHISIRHVTAKPVFPTTARDFIVCTTRTVLKQGQKIVIASKSIEHDEVVPARKTHVRATMHISGYLIQQLKGGETCKVTLICHTNLGGSVPSVLINQFSTSAPLQLMENIKKYSEAAAGKNNQ